MHYQNKPPYDNLSWNFDTQKADKDFKKYKEIQKYYLKHGLQNTLKVYPDLKQTNPEFFT